LVSASIDGELLSADERALDGHLAGCATCRGYAERLAALTRRVRLRSASGAPDLVDRVLDRARPPRLGRGGWVRPALAWVAVVIGVQSVPALFFGDESGASEHVARHLGAFALALAVGLLYAAWRPHRAFGLLPFAVALVVTTLVSAVLDVAGARRTPIAEAVHLTELVGLVLLWMIAGSPGWERWTRWVPSRRRAAR
jgi:predicted anti-sigma-YlaC factor YlaD